MGFRDLHSFNLAMLSKQVWRLISEPDSLCAKVLRAKYYPQGDILKAGPKTGSSFTWQSIMAGLATFKRGYIWRIGTGEKVDIFLDPWIPSSLDRRIVTPRGQLSFRSVWMSSSIQLLERGMKDYFRIISILLMLIASFKSP